MRYTLLIAIVTFFTGGCKKDKYTTAPQIKYKSINPKEVTQSNGAIPVLTIEITDAEGDIGFRNGKDTAFIYRTNKLTGDFDSIPFPDIQSSSKSHFKAEVDIILKLQHNCTPSGGSTVTDTLYYDIYVKDFAKNKSNVITTPESVLYRCF